MEEVITDFENMDFSEVIQTIKEKCNLTDLIICKIEEDNWHTSTCFELVEDLYEWLNDKIQCCDCKNGVEWRKDNNEYYFAIIGSNRYKNDKFIATDEVRIYFRNYKWE